MITADGYNQDFPDYQGRATKLIEPRAKVSEEMINRLTNRLATQMLEVVKRYRTNKSYSFVPVTELTQGHLKKILDTAIKNTIEAYLYGERGKL